MNTLRQAVQEYLALRRALGFKLHDAGHARQITCRSNSTRGKNGWTVRSRRAGGACSIARNLSYAPSSAARANVLTTPAGARQ